MRGTVKFFDKRKGWGFLTGDNGTDYFVHYSSLKIPKYKALDQNDIVEFEIETDKYNREQAINVTPILTKKMIERELRKEKLYLQTMKNALGERVYMVVDANNVIQVGEQGMSLSEVATYAGIEVEGLTKEDK